MTEICQNRLSVVLTKGGTVYSDSLYECWQRSPHLSAYRCCWKDAGIGLSYGARREYIEEREDVLDGCEQEMRCLRSTGARICVAEA